ncbi:hypothetical protein DEO72_LG6g2158 [Vigna unguiculata]|uniref:Uncharacterized protein n=1 Tax=Vigna unguiculata TaxID=3917 RepID=A0A4D6MAL9_VIGUN|nr:hypothetical protein DEO72_LG6g2158 [Vigna unguiculata]
MVEVNLEEGSFESWYRKKCETVMLDENSMAKNFNWNRGLVIMDLNIVEEASTIFNSGEQGFRLPSNDGRGAGRMETL